MDKIQQKKLYIAGGITGGIVVILLVLAFVRWLNTGKEEEYELLKNELQTLTQSVAAYPNEENVALVQAMTTEMQEVATEAKRKLSILPPQMEGEFTNSLNETVKALNACQMTSLGAEKIEGENEYDFKTYLSEGKLPYKDDEVDHEPRLLLQFSIIQDVVEQLKAAAPDVNGKKEFLVTEVKRIHFDTVPADEDTKEKKKSKKRKSRKNKKEDDATILFAGLAVPNEIADEVEQESFEISFRARYATVAKFLNSLNTSDTCYVVNSIKIVPVKTLLAEVKEKNDQNEKKKNAAKDKKRSSTKDKDPVVESLVERLVPNPQTASMVDVTVAFDVYYSTVDEDVSEETDETSDEENSAPVEDENTDVEDMNEAKPEEASSAVSTLPEEETISKNNDVNPESVNIPNSEDVSKEGN